MAKKIRIPAKRADRSVRWTLEVSADTRKAATDAPGAPGKRKKPTVKKTLRAKTVSAKTSQPAQTTTPVDPPASVRMRPSVLAMAAGAFVVIAAMVTMRDTSLRASAAVNRDSEVVASADVPSIEATAHVAPAPRVAAPVVVAASTRAQTPGVAAEKPNRINAATGPASVPVTSAALQPAPVATVTKAEEPTAHAASVDSNASPIASNLTADGASQAPVTITGCLEVTADGDQFRLTDTDGAAAPKARGWRSGFLKKRPAAVELSELRDAAAARRYVGQRVVATGLLESRALRVRSLQSAGAVCD